MEKDFHNPNPSSNNNKEVENPHQSNCTVAELFAGCGGLALGFHLAGFRNIAAVEREEAMCQTYRKNLDGNVFKGDVNDYTVMHNFVEEVEKQVGIGNLDVLAGGFPCQSFSNSGKRLADDPRDCLYQMMIWSADWLRPKYIVGENVPSLLSKKFSNGEKVIDCIVNDFKAINYKVEYKILNAVDYGVAQTRKRLIIIATRNDAPIVFPTPIVSPENYLSVKDVLSDLVDIPDVPNRNHVFVNSTPESIKKFSMTKQGERVNKNRNDGCGRLWWDKPAWTMKHNNGHPAIHPLFDRIITPREMARIQSFPDDFILCGGISKQFEQIGNAVPPLLGKAVALSIAEMEKRRLENQ